MRQCEIEKFRTHSESRRNRATSTLDITVSCRHHNIYLVTRAVCSVETTFAAVDLIRHTFEVTDAFGIRSVLTVVRTMHTPRPTYGSSIAHVQRCSTFEYSIHIQNFLNIPSRQIRVEGYCVLKHVCHVCNFGDVPAREIAVEFKHIRERTRHVSDTLNVPQREICIEGCGVPRTCFG